MQLAFLAILVSTANAATLRGTDPAEGYHSIWKAAEERKQEGNSIWKTAMGSIDPSVKVDDLPATPETPETATSKTDFGYASPSVNAQSATKDLSKSKEETVSAFVPAAVAAGAYSPFLYDPSKYQGGPITPEAAPDSQKSKEARDIREGIEAGQDTAQQASPVAEWFKNRATKASDMVRKSMPAPPDARPDHFESEQEERVWVARQGNRIYQGDHGIGDLVNTLDGLKNLNNKVQAQIIKKFGFLETSNSDDANPKVRSYTMVTKDASKSDDAKDASKSGDAKEGPVASARASDIVPASFAQTEAGKVKADQWEVTFYILLATCVFVFGWWAVKVGWHQRVAEAASEFAFSCKKLLSQTLKSFDASSYTPQDDMKSESSYEVSEGTGTSESSKGALNKHLQGVIDRTKANLDEKPGPNKV